jgi:hypothetical protein
MQYEWISFDRNSVDSEYGSVIPATEYKIFLKNGILVKKLLDAFLEMSQIRWAPDLETKKPKAAAFLNTWLPTWLANSEKTLKGTHP